jgi:hypothetical protein
MMERLLSTAGPLLKPSAVSGRSKQNLNSGTSEKTNAVQAKRVAQTSHVQSPLPGINAGSRAKGARR